MVDFFSFSREARRAQELALREHIRLEDYTEFEDRQAEQLEKYEEIVRKKKVCIDCSLFSWPKPRTPTRIP